MGGVVDEQVVDGDDVVGFNRCRRRWRGARHCKRRSLLWRRRVVVVDAGGTREIRSLPEIHGFHFSVDRVIAMGEKKKVERVRDRMLTVGIKLEFGMFFGLLNGFPSVYPCVFDKRN